MKTISRVSAGTWIRLVLLLAVLVNNALTVFGVKPVPGDGAAWETAVTVTTALAALTAYWKNNSFTEAAIIADEVMEELKNAKNIRIDATKHE